MAKTQHPLSAEKHVADMQKLGKKFLKLKPKKA